MNQNNNDKISKFLNKLIILTKTDDLNWHYLQDSKDIYNFLDICDPNNPFGKIEIDKDSSFYTVINKSYISILKNVDTDDYQLDIIPSTFRATETIYSEENYIEDLCRLNNLIKSKFPNADAVIDEILKM